MPDRSPGPKRPADAERRQREKVPGADRANVLADGIEKQAARAFRGGSFMLHPVDAPLVVRALREMAAREASDA